MISEFNAVVRNIEQEEYFKETAKLPDYSLAALQSLPMLKIALPESVLPEQAKTYLPGTFNRPVMYNGSSFLDPVQLKGTVPMTASELETRIADTKLPDGLVKQLSMELTMKIPDSYSRSVERASSGNSMLGHNPNPAVMSYRDMPKPYTPMAKTKV